VRFSHQESVPVEGCDRRRWPGLQRVVRDFQRGPSEQAPAKRHSALARLKALTCRDASLARPWTANPGEKTSVNALAFGSEESLPVGSRRASRMPSTYSSGTRVARTQEDT